MESFFSRYRNEWVLVGILFVQLIALATQVRVPAVQAKNATADAPAAMPDPNSGGTRLIRVWAAGMVSPFQKLAVNTSHGFRNMWSNYVDLRHVRRENEELRKELTELRFEQARIQQDAEQGKRLQALLDFKQQYINKTVAAQVIGTSGTELSRVIYIDRGTRDGIQAGMAVITPDGIVGKISRADRSSSQVLLINDPQSGAGVLLERLRLNGILKGAAGHYPEMQNVMSDEKIQVGDKVITTGGDHVFPRGLPVGTVANFSADRERDPFLNIKIKPAVELGKLEEVLVVTEMTEKAATETADFNSPLRAADVLAERLPSVKKKTDEQIKAEEKSATGAQSLGETVPSGVDTTATDQSGRPAQPAAKPADKTPQPAKPTTGPAEIKPVVPHENPSNPSQDQPR
jgi:rod shape-determining protein MreC